jgi:hypothetical protein
MKIYGMFKDQQGIVKRGRITGYNGDGVPCRRYRWITPVLPRLEGKSFEAFDDQIEYAAKRYQEHKANLDF